MVNGLSCSAACGIFPDQGSNLCLLHWQADSLPLGHQGGAVYKILCGPVFVSYILRIRIRIFLRKKKNILRIAVSRGCKEEDYFEEFTCLNT